MTFIVDIFIELNVQERFSHLISDFIQQTWDGSSDLGRGHRLEFPNQDVFQSLRIVLSFTDNANPNKMPHSVT